MLCRVGVDLLAKLPDEDVDRPVPSCQAATPDLLEQLVSCHDPRALLRQGVEEPELGRSEAGATAVQVGLDADGVDPQLLDLNLLAALGLLLALGCLVAALSER